MPDLRLLSILALCVIAGAATSSASAASTNLISNGTFENGTTSGWKGTNATLTAVNSDFHSGAWSARVALTSGTNYSIVSAPRPVTGTSAGATYAASAWVKGVGKSICLWLREYNSGGSQVKSQKSLCTTSTAWTQLSIPSYTTFGSGDSIAVIATQSAAVAGNSFLIDDVSLTTDSVPPPPTGTVALWHMDELSGTMVDSAPAGSVADNGTPTNVVQGVPGAVGTAYHFKGSTDQSYVTVPHSADLTPGSADFSFSAKVNFTVNPSPEVVDYDLLRKGLSTTTGGDYKMEILQSGKAFCQWKGSAGNTSITSTNPVPLGGWHTIMCTKTASTVKIKVDSVLKTKTFTVGSITNTAALFIGAKPNADEYLGDMDEVIISKP